MITKLYMQDFQSWSKVELPLGAVTVIIGETDQGKSSIIRALSAVCYNALEGSSFVRSGQSSSVVTITTNDGHEVSLLKGANLNSYILDGKPFDKIGRGVPPEVQDALKISEVEVEGDSLKLQLQSQLDPPFLVTDQGVRATRFLGSISKVAIIYQAVKVAGRKRKDALVSLSTLQTLESEIKQKVASYDYLEDLRPRIEQLVAFDSRLENIEQEKASVSQLSSEISKLVTKVSESKLMEQRLEAILGLRHEFLAARLNLTALESLHKEIETLTKSKLVIDNKIEKAGLLAGLLTRLVRFHERLSILTKEISMLSGFNSLIEALDSVTVALQVTESNHSRVNSELSELISQHTCPTCGRVDDTV